MTPTVADRTIAWSDDFLIGIEELEQEMAALVRELLEDSPEPVHELARVQRGQGLFEVAWS